MTKVYALGGHRFCVTAENEDFQLMANYEPFLATEQSSSCRPVFALSIGSGTPPSCSEDFRQEEESQAIISGTTSDGRPVFDFQWSGTSAGLLECTNDYREGRLVATTGRLRKAAIDNALMVMYALATADKLTALFHAATVSYGGNGYMFLGPSGTGKSTHAGLWLRHAGGAELVNDDNPVVRVGDDGRATVYGSPWSGKTPCYRNVSYPLGAIVVLSQAPHNSISRLSGIRAYAALRPSISGKRWDRRIADGLHATENALAKCVPIFHLECRPDAEAVEACKSAITATHDD